MSYSMRNCLVGVALCLCMSVVHAGPPLITDDPGTPERGHWEIDLSFSYQEFVHQNKITAPSIEVNYGILDHLQFSFTVPWDSTVSSDSGNQRGGLGDSLIGLKYRFLDEEKNGVSMSFAPRATLGQHTLSWSHDRGPSTTTLSLPFQIEKTLGPITAGMDFGVDFQNRTKPVNSAGISLGHEFKQRIELLGEVREQSGSSFRDLNLLANGGFRYHISELITLLGSAGTTFKRADANQPRLFSYFGVQFKF